MRALTDITPTPEQLSIVSRNRTGVEIIRGAAGSGKTTTALLRLTSLAGMTKTRKQRENDNSPVNILVLTFNRTLSGYIKELVREKIRGITNITIKTSTFAKWAKESLEIGGLLTDRERKNIISRLGINISLDTTYLNEEVEYILSRFLPQELNTYLTAKRDGRGATPRVPRVMREQIINDVIAPYLKWKKTTGKHDWFDMEVSLATNKIFNYDVIIADETQDFSANQLRAIMNQVAPAHAVTFIVDTAQRIYARGFTWQECGITVKGNMIHRLNINYRNTKQIAKFAAPLLRNIEVDEDATIPDFSLCSRDGAVPKLLIGIYSKQLEYAMRFIDAHVDLSNESVAFLHPRGGQWFNAITNKLNASDLPYATITRESEWPQGDENIALCTLHSSKGLEFDHVIIIGVNAEVFPHGEDEDDDHLITLRRLLAMGISRAKKSVILGYKPSEKSHLIDFLETGTYEEINL